MKTTNQIKEELDMLVLESSFVSLVGLMAELAADKARHSVAKDKKVARDWGKVSRVMNKTSERLNKMFQKE